MSDKKMMEDCLIEIGSEELPPKALKNIALAFEEGVIKGLKNAELGFKQCQRFVTPRRIGLLISDLTLFQPERNIQKRGPAKNAAFGQDGKPTQAALGFAQSLNVPIEKLKLLETDKGAWLVYEQQEPGQSAHHLIPNIVSDALNQLPLQKRMRWGSHSFSFSRPIHWILLLIGNKVAETSLFGLNSGNLTFGHRFHHPNAIRLNIPHEYEASLLNTGKVIADFEKRKEEIRSSILKTTEHHHSEALLDESLLDEVTGLVEWPVVLVGEFDQSFLELPQEALISSMQTHQKCFALADTHQKLLSKFIIVSNIESKDPSAVIAGNERVMHARLKDAVFYYSHDKEKSLANRREDLKHVIFQHGLGSLYDKTERLASLSKIIASKIGADPDIAERAARLSKSDLLTLMVGEFPELQGIMGRYYALHDGEPKKVAMAIEEHYLPRFANDVLPQSREGMALAIADRIDTLVGIFGLGKRPTGDKDPFALRRQALAVLRMIVEKELNLDLNDLLLAAKEAYESFLPNTFVIQPLMDFCFERFRVWYQEKNIPTKVFDAVIAKWPTKPLDFHHRLMAVNVFRQLPEADSLSAANKRVQNILTKSEIFLSKDQHFETHLLEEPAEMELAALVREKQKEITPLLKANQYTEALKALSTLKDPVDRFFNEVMVMVDNKDIRQNRLKLLSVLRSLFLEIADISLL